MDEIFIDTKTFAKRLDISLSKARDLTRSKALCDKGISVNVNIGGKYGIIRINWPLYLEYVATCPAVPPDKRVS